VTDGKKTYVNSSGSSALAKAGSGDVLAGHLASLVACGGDALKACAFAVYLHDEAADVLSGELSEFGVTPSDLPREIARCLSRLINKK
jgi:NAD(P)H-hydrate epimerase